MARPVLRAEAVPGARHLSVARHAASPARYPALPVPCVDRARLVDRLRTGAAGPLTLVSGPAGAGKTVLVSSWVRSDPPGRVAWLSLDPADLVPATTWSLLLESLERAGVAVPDAAPAGGRRVADEGAQLDSVASALRAAGPTTVVLDCDGPLPAQTAAWLHQVLHRCESGLHLVVIGRVDPPLPLHRYRLAGTVVEIRMRDLAFTAQETRELLTGLEIDLPTSLAQRLTERTWGWVAGLRFAAMSLARRADRVAAVREFTGSTGHVAEYLLAEVLDAQPAAARRLLLRSSIVDVLHPGLAEVLVGPSAVRALALLARDNVFLEEVSQSPGCYAYQPLFRELLRAELGYESPSAVPRLHRTAAGWLAAHGMVVDAVRHSLAAEAWEDAAAHVVDDLAIGQLMVERSPRPLYDLLVRLPGDVPGPAASLVRAALAMAELDVVRCGDHVAEAGRLLDRAGPFREPAAELSRQLVLLVHARARGDAGSVADAADAAERLLRGQPVDRLAAHPELTSLIRSGRGRPGTAASVPRQRRAGGGGGAGPTTVRVLEPLTDKEREVLGHLAELLTTEEIADLMFVSVNTVRTHVRNILRKLAASRRNQAVRRARELRILTS